MRSASLFWPGSEAEIEGKRPSYCLHFDDKFDDEKRVDQIIAWLRLPPALRPHFITLYYSNVDHAGHNYGPDSDEVRAAVHHVDAMVGELQKKVTAMRLPVDFVVVSDHGMVTVQGDPVTLSEFADLSEFHTEGSCSIRNRMRTCRRLTRSSSHIRIRDSRSIVVPTFRATSTSTQISVKAIR